MVQLTSGADRDANLRRAEELVTRASQAGARLIVLPERFAHLDGRRTLEGAEALDGPALTAAAGWAREHGVWLLAGSVAEAGADGGRAHNTSVLIGPDGGQRAVYRKIHLFDVTVGDTEYRESRFTAPGSEVVCAELDGWVLGMSVCYDLRFPELYRAHARAGAHLLAVPAAFTQATGRDHWEVLLRARAIEEQCYVLAAGQFGTHADGTASFGDSMIVDPWGAVIARVPDGEGFALAELDPGRQDGVRRRLPALTHGRLGGAPVIPSG